MIFAEDDDAIVTQVNSIGEPGTLEARTTTSYPLASSTDVNLVYKLSKSPAFVTQS
jgi:hypothetical protein